MRNRPSWMSRAEGLRHFLESLGYQVKYDKVGAYVSFKGKSEKPKVGEVRELRKPKAWWRWW